MSGNMPPYPAVRSAVLFEKEARCSKSRWLPPSIRPQAVGPDWPHVNPIVPIVVALGIATFIRQLP